MATRQYIGARYVIKIYENSTTPNSAEWEANTSYEPITMVTYNNSSYISKKLVPPTVGNPAENGEYWVISGYYNGQIGSLQARVTEIEETMIKKFSTDSSMWDEVPTNNSSKPVTSNGIFDAIESAKGTLMGAVNDEATARATAIDNAIAVEASNRNTAIANAIATEVNNRNDAIATEASIRSNADTALGARIDAIIAPSGEAPSAAEVTDARIGANGVTYPSLGAAIRTQVGDINASIGEWVYQKAISGTRVNFVLPTVHSKIYFKLVEPVEGYVGTLIYGSNDNWSTQTELFSILGEKEFIAEFDVSGYTAIKVAVEYGSSLSTTVKAIIHGYDNCTISQRILDLKSEIDEHSEDISDLRVVKEAGEVTTYSGYYIDTFASRKIHSINDEKYKVDSYEVEKGKTYILRGSLITLANELPLAIFSKNAVADNARYETVLIDGSATPQEYYMRYVAPDNGYIQIAWIANGSRLLMYETQTVADGFTEAEDYRVSEGSPNSKLTGTNYSGYYIDTFASKKIHVISNTDYNVRAYSVTAGETYYLHGKAIKLNSSLPLAIFSTKDVYDNSVYTSVILNGTATHADYTASFTAPYDGYIEVAWIKGQREVGVYSTTEVLSTVTARKEIPQNLKIQLFGDSITDDYWGDKVTWATIFTDYLRNYNINLVNSAVGGSGIGHGYSGTARYSDKEYNSIYDLVTDGTLETDADIIIILGGTNDWKSGTPLGELGDNTYDTAYGALKLIVEYISSHTSALIILATPPQRYNYYDSERPTNSYGEPLNGNNVTLREYCEAWTNTADLYGIPCLNLHSELGWNKLNVHNFCYDGLHPNLKGDEWIAQNIAGEVKKHML